MPERQDKAQQEIDHACECVGALCELLAAARDTKVSAASIHTILKPIAHRLDLAAGSLSDAQHRQ